MGSGDSDTAWMANVFTANANETLAAASFYTSALDTTYVLSVYLDPSSGPTSGSLVETQSGTIAGVEYDTISLNTPVQLTAGQSFAIVVKITTPGFNYPIPIEDPQPNYCAPTANPGESYISLSGALLG